MTTESVREYCLSLKGVTEGFPFGADALVFKVKEKMFALLGLENRWLNLKCDPEVAVALREQYSAVAPGYHMSKKHWNTIDLDGSVPEKVLEKWIRDSYELVVGRRDEEGTRDKGQGTRDEEGTRDKEGKAFTVEKKTLQVLGL